MKRFPAITILLTILIIIIGALSFKSSSQPALTEDLQQDIYEYYWGETCPHCETVQEFLDSWEGEEGINLDKKEVYNNQQNTLLLTKRAAECGLRENNIGVPFLYTPEGECIIGDQPIIDYFKKLK